MAIPGVTIGRAGEADLEGILELQAANQPERGGMLSAELPRSRVDGEVAAFVFNGDDHVVLSYVG